MLPYRRDPAEHVSRSYRLGFQQILWGGTALVHEWGSIGSPGLLRDDHDPDDQAAIVAAARLERSRRRRGLRLGQGREGRGGAPPSSTASLLDDPVLTQSRESGLRRGIRISRGPGWIQTRPARGIGLADAPDDFVQLIADAMHNYSDSAIGADLVTEISYRWCQTSLAKVST